MPAMAFPARPQGAGIAPKGRSYEDGRERAAAAGPSQLYVGAGLARDGFPRKPAGRGDRAQGALLRKGVGDYTGRFRHRGKLNE
jgi:hypothetical protein